MSRPASSRMSGVLGVLGDEPEDMNVLFRIEDHEIHDQFPQRNIPERTEALAQPLQLCAVPHLCPEQAQRLFGDRMDGVGPDAVRVLRWGPGTPRPRRCR